MSALREGIRDGYAQGLPVRVIADRFGTSEAVVRVTAHLMGLRHPNQGRPRRKNLTLASAEQSVQYK